MRIVATPLTTSSVTFLLGRVSKLARRASEGFGTSNAQPSLARRARLLRQEQAFKPAHGSNTILPRSVPCLPIVLSS